MRRASQFTCLWLVMWAVATDVLCSAAEQIDSFFMPVLATQRDAHSIELSFRLEVPESAAEAWVWLRGDAVFATGLSAAELRAWDSVRVLFNGRFTLRLSPEQFLEAGSKGVWRKFQIPSLQWIRSGVNTIRIFPGELKRQYSDSSREEPFQQTGIRWHTTSKPWLQDQSTVWRHRSGVPLKRQGGQLDVRITFTEETANEQHNPDIYFVSSWESVPPRGGLRRLRNSADEPLLWLVRGEAESVQLVVESADHALSGVKVMPQEFRNEDGHLLGSELWSVRRVAYVRDMDRWWPDPLVDVEEQGVHVPRGERRAFWVSLSCGPETRPGLYRGYFAVYVQDGPQRRIAAQIRISKTQLSSFQRRTLAIGSAVPEELVQSFARDGLFPLSHSRTRRLLDYTLRGDGNVDLNFSRFDADVVEWKERGARFFALPLAVGDAAGEPYWKRTFAIRVRDDAGQVSVISVDPRSDSAARRRFRQVIDLFVSHLKNRGWLNDAVLWLYDEPHTAEQFHLLNEYAELIHKAAPEISMMVSMTLGTDPSPAALPSLHPAISIYCMKANVLSDSEVRTYAASGKRLWLYTTTDDGISLSLVRPPLEARLHGWLAYRFGAEALLYWAADFNVGNIRWDADGDSCSGVEPYANGVLYYPPTQLGDSWNSSIRVQAIRDGLEDWALLSTREANRPGTRGDVQQRVQALMRSAMEYSRTSAEYEALRRAVILTLEEYAN